MSARHAPDAPDAGDAAPGRRYLAWIGGAMVAVALASAMVHAAVALRDARAVLARGHRQQIDAVALKVRERLADVGRALREVLADVDASGVAGSDRRRNALLRLLRRQPDFVSAFLVGDDGRVVARADRQRLENVAPDLEVIRLAMALRSARDGLATVLATDFHEAIQPRAWLASRRTPRSEFVLVAEMGLSSFDAMLAPHATAADTAVAIVDHSGRLLASAAGASMRHWVAGPTSAGSDSTAALVARLIGPADRRRVVSSRGALPEFDAQIVVATDERLAFAPLVESLRTGAAIVVASAAVALLLSGLLARRIAGPLQRLADAAARVGAGDRDLRLRPAAFRELAPLARSLNELARQIGASRGELEQRVAERTAELERAKRDAERADAAKSLFIAAASHDLRQPLHAVGVLAALLTLRAPAGELQRLALQLQDAVQALEAFFAELLDLSRLEQGQVVAQRKRVPLGPLLARVGRRFAVGEPAARLRVVPSRLVVTSDPLLLERMVQNLVANALAHTGQARVLVGVRRGPGPDRARIEVHDAGAGIAVEHRERIFDAFYRVPQPGAAPGLGLGLAIVQRFSALLHHAVTVGDSPGGGARFTIELPLAPATEDDASEAEHEVDRTWPHVEGLFVLIVDDDASARESTGSLLSRCGCHTVVAASADEAAAVLQAHLREPDIVVSDYRFAAQPDGFAEVVALRDRLDPTIPIVLVTGDVAASGAPHAAASLLKPVQPQQLLAAIAAAVAGPAVSR